MEVLALLPYSDIVLIQVLTLACAPTLQQIIDDLHRVALHVCGDMGVQIHSDANGRVSKHGRNDFVRNLIAEHQRGISVTQVVKTNVWQLCFSQLVFEAMLQGVGCNGRTIRTAAYQPHRIVPLSHKLPEHALLVLFLSECLYQEFRKH